MEGKKVKIFVVEPYTGTPGHFEQLAVRTCEGLAQLDNDVVLITYGGVSTDWSNSSHSFKVVDAAPEGAKDLDARYCNGRFDVTSFRVFLKRMVREFRTFRLALHLLEREQFSVAHFYDADPLPFTLALSAFQGHRRHSRPIVVLTIHEVGRLRPSTPEVIRLSRFRIIKRRVYRWIYRCLLARLIKRSLDGIVVFDPSVRKGLLSFPIDGAADRIRVVPYGTDHLVEKPTKDEARKRLKLDLRETIFLIFGVLRKDKRIDLAIEAIKDLHGCRLVIAGGAHEITETTIKQLTRRHACEQVVSSEIRYIPEPRMHDYFLACDAVIIPYLSTFKGVSAILTMACGHGRSVIASDVGLLGETVKEQKIGFAVEPDNARALRDGMVQFLSLTPEERLKMEDRVQAFARLLSWDSVCAQYIEFYRMLLRWRESSSPR